VTPSSNPEPLLICNAREIIGGTELEATSEIDEKVDEDGSEERTKPADEVEPEIK